ncbi:MAG: hypothetical protein VXV97_14310 [Pseudomonadota bacterium]|nr:hypothetical protein [Pseudomonadota bacterium]
MISPALVWTTDCPLAVAPVTVPVTTLGAVAALVGVGMLGGVTETIRTLNVVPGGSEEGAVPVVAGTAALVLTAPAPPEMVVKAELLDVPPSGVADGVAKTALDVVGAIVLGAEVPAAPAPAEPELRTVALVTLPCVRVDVTPVTWGACV